MKKINNKGFTLIELLATIIILSVVLSITLSVSLDVINKARERTYQVTLKNVESNASNYLLENKDRLFYLPGVNNTEYQCLTVKNLIDYGYLDNNVTESLIAKDTYVNPNNYIYIERNATTKAVTKSIYITDESSHYANICNIAVEALGNISFTSQPDFDTWANSKTVTITYRLRNINDVSTIGDYKYNYNYDGASVCNNGCNDFNNLKTINVTSNGTVNANIKIGDRTIVTKSQIITKIDTIKPTISIINKGTTGYNNNILTFSFMLNDSESSINYASFTKDDLEITHYTTSTIFEMTQNSDKSYTIVIKNFNWNNNLELRVANNKFFDNAGNGNNETIFKFAKPGVCSNLTYNGNSQTLAVNGNNVSYQNNTRTNAGSQTVTMNSSDGYIFIDNTTSKSLSCSIAKRNITVTASNQSKTYDGTSLNANNTCSVTNGTLLNGQTITCTSSGSRTDAGSSTKELTNVTISSGSTNVSSNYNITKVNGTLTVNKATSTITCANKTYTGSAQTIASCSGGTVQNATQTNAGSYTITCTGDSNHTDASSQVCSISKTAAVITCANKTYTGSAQTIASCSGGTVQNATQTNAGSYTITCSGDSNHSNASSQVCSISKTVAVITCANKTYTGSAQTIASCSGGTVQNATQTNAGSYTITCTGDSNHTNAASQVCSISKTAAVITCANKTYIGSAQTIASCSGGTVQNATQTNAGSYTITCTGDSNHTNASSQVCSISKPAAVITCSNKTYTGSAQTIASCSGGTVKNASQTNAGSYTVTCTGDSTHTDATSQVCSISKTAAIITCANKEYTGGAQTIATCSGGTVKNASQTNVGNYTVTCTGDSNHTDATAKTCSITNSNACGYKANCGYYNDVDSCISQAQDYGICVPTASGSGLACWVC